MAFDMHTHGMIGFSGSETSASSVAADRRHLAIFKDVDAPVGRRSRVAPGDRVVTRRAAVALQSRSEHGIAEARVDAEDGAELLGLFGSEPFIRYAGEPIGIDVALERLLLVMVVREHHNAARGVHQIVIELLREGRPHPVRVAINAFGGFPEIVRANDRRVAPGVAAPQPAFLDDGDVLNYLW